MSLLFGFKFLDYFYVGMLADVVLKVLGSYTTLDLADKREVFYDAVLFFCDRLVLESDIKLEEGKRNPFNRAFEVLTLCFSETR